MYSYTKVWLRAINYYVLQGTDTYYFDLNYGSELVVTASKDMNLYLYLHLIFVFVFVCLR